MKTVISFTEGCSGNFLAALISNSDVKSFKRIDIVSNRKDANFIMLPFMESGYTYLKV